MSSDPFAAPRAAHGRAPNVFRSGEWIPMRQFPDGEEVDFVVIGTGAGGASLGEPARDPLDQTQVRADDVQVLDGEPVVGQRVDGALGIGVVVEAGHRVPRQVGGVEPRRGLERDGPGRECGHGDHLLVAA